VPVNVVESGAVAEATESTTESTTQESES